MRALLLIALTPFCFSAYGQTEKHVSIPIHKNQKNELDTSLWYKWKYELARQIDLTDLQTSAHTFHFRFWIDVQAIDLWTTDHCSYFGLITNYAQRYDDKLLRKGIYKIGKVYSNQITLDTAKAKKLFNMIRHLSIVDLPSDHDIEGWGSGFDGEEYLIEVSTTSEYQFKTYWTPRIFTDSLKEARQIQEFIDFLNDVLKIKEYYKLKLPKGTYRRDGIQGVHIRMHSEWVPGATKVTDLL